MDYVYHFNNLFKEPLICDKFAVYQVGELMASGSTIVTDHFQYCYEITYVVSGRGESVTDGIASPLSGGDCYLSFTDEWHRISSDKQDPLRYRFAGFTSEDPQIIAVFNELKIRRKYMETDPSSGHNGRLNPRGWRRAAFVVNNGRKN